MEDAAPAMAIRHSERAAPLPPHAGSSGRRRRQSGASSAWPAFPGDANVAEACTASGIGLGCGRQSPVSSVGTGDGASCRSPFSQSSSFSGWGSVSGSGSTAGAGVRRHNTESAARVNGCGIKSPGIARKKASCCDSCRPHSHHTNHNHQHHGRGSSGIEYDDVFGGPPKYLASVPNGRNVSIPDYDDIFQSSSRRSFSSTPGKSKSRTAELPVFDPPEYDTEVFKGPSASQPRSPAASAADIAYDDVFGGPLTGPRAKLLKDLLRCSGFAESKGSKSKASSQSGSSPVSSLHSLCRGSHGNQVFEYESEVYGDGKHFNSPRKSSLGSVNKSPQPYPDVELNQKPAATSVSASSSPFTEQFDDSTVHSYSTRAFRPANHEKGQRNGSKSFVIEADAVQVASSSNNESSESDYTRRSSARHAPQGKNHRKHRGSKNKRPSRVRTSQRDVQGPNNSEHVEGKLARSKPEKLEDASGPICDSSPAEQDYDFDIELATDLSAKCLPRKSQQTRNVPDDPCNKEPNEVPFVTVSNVKLTTEPTATPPARPAPSKSLDVLSEKEMSELLETEAFMEYSIKDLDGLVAEEYIVSQGSVSESSPSVSKTSASGRSYEDEDSDHCYAKDAVSPEAEPESSELEKLVASTFEAEIFKQKERFKSAQVREEEGLSPGSSETKSVEAVHLTEIGGGDKEGPISSRSCTTDLDGSKSKFEEIFSSSSSSFREQMSSKEGSSPPNACDDLSSLCEIKGETPERRRARWERHQRSVDRVAKALAEKNSRELEHERAQAEKQRAAELLDDVIKRWAAGKQGNLRALLSTLQYILWPECGWQVVSLIDIIEPASVRKAYRKATLCVHPDKLQQKSASTEHKYIAEKVFDLLQEAWTSFNYEQMF